MKKYIFMAVVGMLALSSCSKDDEQNIENAQKAPQQMTFTAGFGDGATTRATLNANKSVTFDNPDYISIFSANNNNVKFTTTTGGAEATFSGEAVAGDGTYYAVYPYKAGLTRSGTTISGIVIPNDQSAAASSACGWDPAAPIAYATTTGSSLQFSNACALLKITNNAKDNASTISVNASEGMSGNYDLDTSNGSLSVSGSTSNFVNVNSVPLGKTFYIAIKPGTYTSFKAQCQDVWKRGKKSSVTFEAGKIYDLGNVNDWAGWWD